MITPETLLINLLNDAVLIGQLDHLGVTERYEIFYSEYATKFVISSLSFAPGDSLPISDHELMFRSPYMLAHWLSYYEGLVEWQWVMPEFMEVA